jgi:hypothetical protein
VQGGRPWRRGVLFGICIRAGLEPANGEDLVPGPDLDGEGAEAAPQDGIGDELWTGSKDSSWDSTSLLLNT